MKNTYHINTKLIGLIGHPIKHSYSPFIHNVAAELNKLDVIYLSFDVPANQLRNSLKGMKAIGILGFNVTVPHKEKILPYLHFISEEASIVGAVNTVVNDHGKLTGFNTDIHGVYETLLPHKNQIAGENVTIVGAGGSARAVIYTLVRNFKPKSISILNRTEQKAYSLKNYFKTTMKYDSFRTAELFPPENKDMFADSKLIINTTPVGMAPDKDDSVTTIGESFKKDQIVFDLVYNPAPSRLLKIAAANGAITIDGLNMLIHQAAKSFELWTGSKMQVEKIHDALRHMIAE